VRTTRRAASAALVALLAACGGGGDEGRATVSMADPVTLNPAPQALRGTWRTVSVDGVYEMTIEPTQVHIAGPEWVQSGAISVEGERMWLFAAPWAGCGGGWYRWAMEGSTLRFVNPSDGCGHRLNILTWAPWTRVQ
jgi:hypothetical protein